MVLLSLYNSLVRNKLWCTSINILRNTLLLFPRTIMNLHVVAFGFHLISFLKPELDLTLNNPLATGKYRHNFHFHAVIGPLLANCYQWQGNNSSRLSTNSEASASELIENLEEMFPRYYSHTLLPVARGFQSDNTYICVFMVRSLSVFVNFQQICGIFLETGVSYVIMKESEYTSEV